MVSYLKKHIKAVRLNKALPEKTQLAFLVYLHRLLENGYSLTDALEKLKWEQEFIETAETIEAAILRGESLDRAFEIATFHDSIISYLYFIHMNGNLLTSIEKCIVMFEHRVKYIEKFKRMIRYPIFLMLVLILLLLFLKQYVLPLVLNLFQSSSHSSTTVTFSILIIDFFSTTFLSIVCVAATVYLLWGRYKHRISIEQQIKLFQKIPFYRKFLKLYTSYYFSTHVSMFLKSDLPFKEIMENMSRQKKLPILSHYATLLTEQLQQGVYVDSLLSSFYFIDNQISTIFQKNINADSLEQDLSMYADFTADKLQRKMEQLLTYIQPVFFITLASFIIFIYITLMLPMFQLIQTI